MDDKPLSLDTILGEFPDDYEAWVLQDNESHRYVIVPDDRFPERRPIRFFMTEADAATLFNEILKVNYKLRGKAIHPVRVNLKRAMRGVAADRNPGNADSFVVHSRNEVMSWSWDRGGYVAEKFKGAPSVPIPESLSHPVTVELGGATFKGEIRVVDKLKYIKVWIGAGYEFADRVFSDDKHLIDDAQVASILSGHSTVVLVSLRDDCEERFGQLCAGNAIVSIVR
jgi:hypothetical protein